MNRSIGQVWIWSASATPMYTSQTELIGGFLSEGALCAGLANRALWFDSKAVGQNLQTDSWTCGRLLLLLLVVETVSPAVQFFRQAAQYLLSIPPGFWNYVGVDVLD